MRPGRAPVTDATGGMRHARAAGRAVSHRLPPRHGFHSIAGIRSESPALDLRHPAAVRSTAAVEERSP